MERAAQWQSAVDWGSAPDWFAAVGTIGAVAVALGQAHREARLRARAEKELREEKRDEAVRRWRARVEGLLFDYEIRERRILGKPRATSRLKFRVLNQSPQPVQSLILNREYHDAEMDRDMGVAYAQCANLPVGETWEGSVAVPREAQSDRWVLFFRDSRAQAWHLDRWGKFRSQSPWFPLDPP
ncbi:hypothetical protein [Micrococcus luteus]|uniref:hypothetical protein n=1 Tax=Micrococcus luteus TaxID=1270 RepID=UPI0034DACEBE